MLFWLVLIIISIELKHLPIGTFIHQSCKDTKTYDCQFDGLINMGPCLFGSPLYFSKANFKDVDRKIRDLVGEGVEDPRIPERQSFYLEPLTGTPVMVNLTLMGSIKITRQRYLRDLSGVNNLQYMPLFTTTEVSTVQCLVCCLKLFSIMPNQ